MPIPPRDPPPLHPLLRPLHNPTQGRVCGANPIKGGRRSSPLQGERQTPPYPAAIGEGASGQPSSGYATVSFLGDRCLPQGTGVGVNRLKGARRFTLSKGRGECWRLRQQKVRGLPVVRPPPAPIVVVLPTPSPPLFTLSGDLCVTQGRVCGANPIRGDADLHPLLGERQTPVYPPAIGEGASGQPSRGYAKLSPRGAASAAGPGRNR